MRIIAVMNQKGGVGKSTTTLNIAHALSLSGYKVTVVDMDPQGHLTISLGITDENVPGIDTVLLHGTDIKDVLMPIRDGLKLVPAGPKLSEFEVLTEGGSQRGWRLHNALQHVLNDQDIALIDCPPSTGMLSMNVLFATQEVLVPVPGDYLAMHGLSRFIKILNHIDEALGRETRVWIAMTRYQQRRRLARDIREKLVEYFPGRVLCTPVRECVALAESPSFGQSIFEYQAKSHGAEDYRALTRDMVESRVL